MSIGDGLEPVAVRPRLVSVLDGHSGRDLSEAVQALGDRGVVLQDVAQDKVPRLAGARLEEDDAHLADRRRDSDREPKENDR